MNFSKRIRSLLGWHWLMLVIAGVLFVLVATLVDLKPVVGQNFFFSTSDPGIQQTKKIERRFPSQPAVILAVSSRDISSSRYLSRIQRLTQRVHTIGGVSAVKSLAEGPKSFEGALKSPFWSRLLIAHDRKSSNVIIFMKGRHTEQPIQRLEQIVHERDAPNRSDSHVLAKKAIKFVGFRRQLDKRCQSYAIHIAGVETCYELLCQGPDLSDITFHFRRGCEFVPPEWMLAGTQAN